MAKSCLCTRCGCFCGFDLCNDCWVAMWRWLGPRRVLLYNEDPVTADQRYFVLVDQFLIEQPYK